MCLIALIYEPIKLLRPELVILLNSIESFFSLSLYLMKATSSSQHCRQYQQLDSQKVTSKS